MSREIDRRNPNVTRVTPVRSNLLHEAARNISAALPGDHTLAIAGFDAVTGNPSVVVSAAASMEKGNYIQRALHHIQDISPVLGFAETQTPEFVADPHIQSTSSGAITVHLQQQYKGIRIFQAAQGVRFNPDGSLAETVGSSVTIADELNPAPRLTVQEAVLKAAQHVAEPQPDETQEIDDFGQPFIPPSVDVAGFTPGVVAAFSSLPESQTVLEAGPFGEQIKANLIWFPLENALRLAWEVLLTMPDYTGQYRTMVDAANGKILYCRQLLSSVMAQGNVYTVDGADGRTMTTFPRPLADYGVALPDDLPSGFPDSWVASEFASGNAVNAQLANTGNTLQGEVQNGVLTFDPTDQTGDEQKILNIFYYNCYIHDFLYLYGFREADGNFQQDNFGRGGAVADPVLALAHSGPVNGTANMATRIDGVSPIMNMGLVAATNRHTAFDSSVVFHEFMHGVTNRLVGGPMNVHALEDYQSAGMGEGWGDYIACTINKTDVVGSWVVDRPNGIRGFPYNNFPDNFGMLGTGRYNRPELNRQHAVGEMWCAALLEMNRQIGAHLGVQLVVDALKLAPVRPSFLDMRDSILKALENKRAAGQMSEADFQQNRDGIWRAFAGFGMGPNASSNGASLSGIVADFNPPAPPPPAADLTSSAVQPADESYSYKPEELAAINNLLGENGVKLADDAEWDFEKRQAFADVLAALRVHGEELAKLPGVVSVSPGYRFLGGRITTEPALVVRVLRKRDLTEIPVGDLIPRKLGKVLVDVAPATPLEQWHYYETNAANSLTEPTGRVEMSLPGENNFVAEPAAFVTLLPYQPPAQPLAAVDEEMTVVCHASPDAGWRNLKLFIEGTQARLTATMYEFNAGYILDALLDSLDDSQRLNLILDGGSSSQIPSVSLGDVSKEQVRSQLRGALDQRFNFTWAAVADDGKSTASFFPSAYHIKVAVRDGESFWLSSGNWKRSGQPELDPINGPLPPNFDGWRFQLRQGNNREWHVIIHNSDLAQLFETYINSDISQAISLQSQNLAPQPFTPLPELFVPVEAPAALASLVQPQFFPEREFTKQLRVQPLLTPDTVSGNYVEHILPLIENAQSKLYFQNQSLKPNQTNANYKRLFRALRDKTNPTLNPNLDVRIIVSEFTDLTALQNAGFDLSRVRVQQDCHNKGILVDDRLVVVGSHNWTGQGATQNRDASLIFDDAEIAAYYTEIFLYDWSNF